MKVRTLRKILEKVDSDANIIIDNDENGFYPLEGFEIIKTSDGTKELNLISSNES